MEYWLDQGVDGLRLDAIPYLVEREGTSNENLRETHDVIKRIRAVINERYADRMLLAEANQWPEDVRDYFGDGDECHMAYHFPLMPRMYMAIAQEDRHPIVEIMEQTPDIPDNCQWAIFLRNHDELTLEMVTSRERDYMYKMYAADPRARLNLGIRRRLAPLHGERSGAHQADEQPAAVHAGRADHLLRRRDRHGRQLLPRRPQRRAHAHAVESGSQRRLLARRSAAAVPAADHGSDLRLRGGERRGADPRPLLAAELDEAHAAGAQEPRRPSAAARCVSSARAIARCSCTCASTTATSFCASSTWRARRSRWRSTSPNYKGTVPIELLGRTPFPPVGELPYLLTLPGYGFYWFRLSREEQPPAWHDERLPREDLPVLVLFDGWTSFFPERVANWRTGLATRLREQLETRVAPQFIAAQRWYAGKGAPIRARAAG